MTLFASLSLGCALPVLAALAALCDLDDAASALHLPRALVAVIAIAVLSLAVGLVAFLARHRLPGERPSPDSLLVRLGRRSLRLPGPRLSLLQLLITALDVAAAATVLYLLLPETPPFAAFLLVYLLALAAGVLSHVPGGVGVFEAVLLAAFAGQLGAAPLAAALLLYRLIYVVLPLLLACLLLLFLEARRLWVTRQAIRVASGFAAPILAILVFLSGVVLLFSGATPAIDTRLEHLGFLIPHRLIDASHLVASLIGVLCLLLAQGLRRRLSAAWALTLVLLLVGALLSLLKGFDWEEASLLSLTAALLAMFRRSFYRPSRLMEVPFSPLYVGASICVVGASVWLLLFANQDVHYSNQLWWQFALDADAPRALRAALGSCLLLLALALGWLLRAAPPAIREPNAEELQRAARIIRHSDQPDGGLALTGDKALLFHESDDAFLMALEFHEPGQAPLDELKAISDAWLGGKQVREKGFSLGRFTPAYLNFFRIAIVRHQGKPVAFANLLETDSRELASLDLMRVHPDAPKLTMEFLMLGLILHYKAQGHARFSLGMVPLAGLQPRRGAPLTQRLGALVFRRGEQFYNFQGLRRFKDKFQPDWEPRYLAVPAGLDPLVALADTAALIAGGLTGLVKR